MTLSVGGTIVVEANGKIQWARISNAPTIYYGVAATETAGANGSVIFDRIQTSGTNIQVRCILNAVE